MYSLAIFSSILLLIISVPIFLVFGIGSSAAAIVTWIALVNFDPSIFWCDDKAHSCSCPSIHFCWHGHACKASG